MDQELSTAVLAAVIDPTMVIGEDGVIIYFNPAACEAFQMESKQAIGSNVSCLMGSAEQAHEHDRYMQNYRETGVKKMIGRNRTVLAKRADGSTWNASLSISEVTLEGKRFFVGTLRDVTESLKKQKLFESVINEAIDAIFTINEKGIITLVNRSACETFGYTTDELLGQNISILMPESHRARHDSYIHDHLETGVKKMIGTDRTVTAQKKDKSEFKCRLGLSRIETGEKEVLFVGILHDLTNELKAREADARAELADKMRKQKAMFLASMSHEIRTPLNGIFGMLELLNSTKLDDVQSEWLATCSRSAQSLTTILDDILLFSRADGGGITLERISFNIRDAIEDAVTVLASKTNNCAIDLVYTVSRLVPDFVIGDPTRLRQTLLIFLSNALKFTQVGHVALEVGLYGVEDDSSDEDSSDDDEDSSTEKRKLAAASKDQRSNVALKFEISDTGIGMSKKQVKKLFQPFTQADAGTTRQYGGTGLGLSIAKKLVSLMDGEIRVESRPGRGSTFMFSAVVENDPDGSTAASDLQDNIPKEDLELLKNTHILSIDDNAVNTDYIVNLLKLVGCDVVGARSGVDGIELLKLAALKDDPYEIILLDYAMPHMSGVDVAELIASSPSIAATNMKTIMLGSIDVHRRIAACPFVDGFTTKPIRRFPLLKMIIEQLKIKRKILSTTTKTKSTLPPSAENGCYDNTNNDQSNGAETKDCSNMPSRGLGPNRPPKPLSILIVEDNLINQKVMVSILTRWKCHVTTALNGMSGFEERVAHTGKKSFDLCLMDLHMPLCDGFQCVKLIREWETKKNQPHLEICAVTADTTDEVKDQCLSREGGFDQFLAKPLRKNVLRNMVANKCGEERLAEETKVRSGGTPMSPNSITRQPGATHVLVVDDSPTMRLLLRTFLGGMGCNISEASSGESAIELVRSSIADKNNPEPIEMIICDMKMPPGINGIETARRIKEISGAADVPIIGMTADEVATSVLHEARAAGMANMVSKPLGRAELASFLEEHTGTMSLPSSEQKEDYLDGKPRDFEKNKALEICSGDAALLKNLLSEISVDLSSKKEELRTAVHRKDSARVAEISHDIKGMASMCGFSSLSRAAAECQDCASVSDYAQVRNRSQVVCDAISSAIKISKAEITPTED